MSDILIRNIPPALKDRLENSARQARASLSATAIALLQRGMDAPDGNAPGPSAWEQLRSVLSGVGGDDLADALDAGELSRKQDFGRGAPE